MVDVVVSLDDPSEYSAARKAAAFFDVGGQGAMHEIMVTIAMQLCRALKRNYYAAIDHYGRN